MREAYSPTLEVVTPGELAKLLSITVKELSEHGDRIATCSGEWRIDMNEDRPGWRFWEDPEFFA